MGSTAPQAFNQFRVLLGYGYPTKRGFSGAANLGFDANLGFLQYAAVQTAYNWDCCGLSVEYRRFALGSVRNENQFRFNFALANIGSFGNLRRQESSSSMAQCGASVPLVQAAPVGYSAIAIKHAMFPRLCGADTLVRRFCF